MRTNVKFLWYTDEGDTIGIPQAHAAPGLDRLTTLLLLGFAAAVQLSIAAAQILLECAAPLLGSRP